MNKKQLLDHLARPSESSASEWQELGEAAKEYPYSSVLQLMWLAGAKVWTPNENLGKQYSVVKLHITDNELLEKTLKNAKAYEPVLDEFDIMKEINDYQEPSFKTAPKNEILTKFLDSSQFSIDDAQDNDQEENIEQLAKQSVNSNNTLPTETLAIIFEKQGKKDKAIETYEKLMARYPEKSSKFAQRIAELKAM